jgi:cell division protease FtsH
MSILNKIVSYLLERENLSGEDIDKIIKGEELVSLSESSSIDTKTKKKFTVEKKVASERIMVS